MTSLSWALGALCYNEVCDEGNHIQDDQHNIKYKERVITEAGHIMNDLLHEEIKRQSFSESQHAQLDPSLNIDQYPEGVNPLLLQFLPSTTCTVRERQYSSLGCIDSCSDSN